MEKQISFLKTTLLGGVIFLLPLVLLVTVLGKAVQIMMLVAEPLDRWIPVGSIGGIALVNLIAIIAVFLACFLAGFAAKSALGERVFQTIDKKLLAIPGYAIFKERLAGNIGGDEIQSSLIPVMVTFIDRSEVGFEVARLSDTRVAIYLPMAPDPWSGNVIFVTEDQVEPLDIPFPQAMRIFESLGRNSAKVLEKSE